MLNIDDIVSYAVRVKKSEEALPDQFKAGVIGDLSGEVEAKLASIYGTKLATGTTFAQAALATEFTEVLPVVDNYCDRLGITNSDIRTTIRTYALEFAAQALFIRSSADLDYTLHGGMESLPALTDDDVADIVPARVTTVADFAAMENEATELAGSAAFGAAEFARLRVVYAKLRGMMNAIDDGEMQPIPGITVQRENALLTSIDTLAVRFKDENHSSVTTVPSLAERQEFITINTSAEFDAFVARVRIFCRGYTQDQHNEAERCLISATFADLEGRMQRSDATTLDLVGEAYAGIFMSFTSLVLEGENTGVAGSRVKFLFKEPARDGSK